MILSPNNSPCCIAGIDIIVDDNATDVVAVAAAVAAAVVVVVKKELNADRMSGRKNG